MDIKNEIGSKYFDYYFQPREHEVRKSDKVSQLQQAIPVNNLNQLSEKEMAKGISYFDEVMNSLKKYTETKYSYDLERIFPWPTNDKIIERTTTPRKYDNEAALEIKDGYKKLYMEMKHDLNYAKKLVEKLGDGTHELVDGNQKKIATVSIIKDKSGDIVVSINKPDGSKLQISYNENIKDVYKIEKMDINGNEEILERNGTTCTRTKNNVFEKYYIDESGKIIKEESGPRSDDYKKTVINKDGSTGTFILIYIDDEGKPVYEITHKPSKAYNDYEDVSACNAIEALKEKNPDGNITALEMYKLIIDATSDPDNQAAGKEYKELVRFVENNWNRLSPEAKKIWQIYQDYALRARNDGETGLSKDQYDEMERKVRELSSHML